jgi:hypothetical protein
MATLYGQIDFLHSHGVVDYYIETFRQLKLKSAANIISSKWREVSVSRDQKNHQMWISQEESEAVRYPNSKELNSWKKSSLRL